MSHTKSAFDLLSMECYAKKQNIAQKLRGDLKKEKHFQKRQAQ